MDPHGENDTLVDSVSDRQLNETFASKELAECLFNSLRDSGRENTVDVICERVWDNIFCWPETPGGTVVSELCSVAFAASEPSHAKHLQGNATRFCLENGTWSEGVRTNYDECANSFEEYQQKNLQEKHVVFMVQNILFVGSILSLVCLAISLVIFYNFRCLRCDRVALLVQLMIALTLRFAVLLIITEPFVLKRDSSYRDYEILCKIVILLHLYATVSSVSWMFVQGFYLNNKLTSNSINDRSRSNFPLYYFIGWAAPGFLLGLYFVAMLFRENSISDNCWKGYADMPEIWILLGPMVFALMLNAVFLLNILRILVRKMRRSTNRNAESSQISAAAKATLILSPVLGINNLLLLYNPGGEYEKYYVILNASLGATQGICVSVVYCFCNQDVREAIVRLYRRKIDQNLASSRQPCTSTVRINPSVQHNVNAGGDSTAVETLL